MLTQLYVDRAITDFNLCIAVVTEFSDCPERIQDWMVYVQGEALDHLQESVCGGAGCHSRNAFTCTVQYDLFAHGPNKDTILNMIVRVVVIPRQSMGVNIFFNLS